MRKDELIKALVRDARPKKAKSNGAADAGSVLLDIFEGWKVVLASGIEGTPRLLLSQLQHPLKSHFISDCDPDAKTLTRYVIAYGGDVVPDYRADEATHVFYPSMKSQRVKEAINAKHLEVAYLVDSLKLRKLPDSDISYKI